MTSDQVARRFFVGKRAAYRRIAVLIARGMLRTDPWMWNHPHLIRATRKGAKFVNSPVGPAHVILSQIRHSIKLVDLVDDFLAKRCPNTTLTTERELRAQLLRERAHGRRAVGVGRIPDAVLTFTDGRRVAIELELSRKATRDYVRILRAYASERYDSVWWFVPSQRAYERLIDIARREYLDELFEVMVWP